MLGECLMQASTPPLRTCRVARLKFLWRPQLLTRLNPSRRGILLLHLAQQKNGRSRQRPYDDTAGKLVSTSNTMIVFLARSLRPLKLPEDLGREQERTERRSGHRQKRSE
jgi:hypothetical protein